VIVAFASRFATGIGVMLFLVVDLPALDSRSSFCFARFSATADFNDLRSTSLIEGEESR